MTQTTTRYGAYGVLEERKGLLSRFFRRSMFCADHPYQEVRRKEIESLSNCLSGTNRDMDGGYQLVIQVSYDLVNEERVCIGLCESQKMLGRSCT